MKSEISVQQFMDDGRKGRTATQHSGRTISSLTRGLRDEQRPKPRVVLLTALRDDNPLHLVLNELHGVRLHYTVVPTVAMEGAFLRADVAGADVLISRPTDPFRLTPLAIARANRPLTAVSLGVEAEQYAAIRGLPGVRILNAPGGNLSGVAELGLLGAVLGKRPVHEAIRQVEEGRFTPETVTGADRIQGRTVAILGAGDLASRLPPLLQPYRPGRIVVWNRTMDKGRLLSVLSGVIGGPGTERVVRGRRATRILGSFEAEIEVEGVGGYENLPEAVSDADFVILALRTGAGVDGERGSLGLIDRTLIDCMKPGVVLVNIARASLVVPDAVLAGLRSGRIGCYFTDVVADAAEAQRDSRLCPIWSEYCRPRRSRSRRVSRLNLIVTPHVGARTITDFHATCTIAVNRLLEALRIRR
jgi:phosphoglycerate dehydrogenase-like enzyme